jgi:hypothetical protein
MFVCPVILLEGKGVRVSTPFINTFPRLPFPGNGPLRLSPPFNIATIIKPMNKEEKEAPLEDLHVYRNRLAQEKHVARSEKQCATYANRRTAQLFKTKCFFEINTV